MNTKRVEFIPDRPFSRAEAVTAGDLTAVFEEGNLRYIRYREHEITRMIYPAIRDENWKTLATPISGMSIDKKDSSFRISYSVLYDEGDIKFDAKFLIEGSEGDTISFVMSGRALTSFKSRRVGLCVLHPVHAAAGCAISVTKPDGRIAEERLPEVISLPPPFTDVKGMAWTTPSGVDVQIAFDGDVFETEDQRNWGDNSYKTYSGPQYYVSLLDMKAGDTMEQRITLKARAGGLKNVPLSPEEKKTPLPSIGYNRNVLSRVLTDAEVRLALAIPFDHYRVEIHTDNPTWEDVLKSAYDESVLLKVRLELAVFLSAAAMDRLNQISEIMKAYAHSIKSISILSLSDSLPSAHVYRHAYDTFKKAMPGVPVGYGTDVWFANLNQAPPADWTFDFVSFPYHPQVHLSDSRTILENTGGIPAIVDTARRKTGARHVHLSPITFDNRPGRDAMGNIKPAEPDERMHSWFGCWWMMRMMFGPGSPDLVTMFDLTGSRGMIDTKRKELSPLYQALKTIREFDPVYVIQTPESPEAGRVPGAGTRIVFENANGDRLYFTF